VVVVPDDAESGGSVVVDHLGAGEEAVGFAEGAGEAAADGVGEAADAVTRVHQGPVECGTGIEKLPVADVPSPAATRIV
jgi:hypothetical protein